MGLFRKTEDNGMRYQGGCSTHGTHGAERTTFKKANRDTHRHDKQAHGGGHSSYIEGKKK